jgi:hypothetical protein
MSFTFNKNDEPIDMSTGGDSPKQQAATRGVPTKATPAVAPQQGRQLPAPVKPRVPTGPPLPIRQAESTTSPLPARLPLPTPPRQELPVYTPQEHAQPQYAPQEPQQAPVQENVQPQQEYTQHPSQQPQQAPQQYAPVQPEYNQHPPQQQYAQPQQAQPEYNEYPPQQQYAQPQQDYVQPPQQQYTPPAQQTSSPKGKGSTFKKEKPVRPTKAPRPQKEPKASGKKQNAFSGERRKVLIARVTVFSILGLLMLAGVNSFIPKTSGLSASDGPLIISKVKESLNITDFPKTAGEGMALGFTQVYLNYDPTTREERVKELSSYAGEGIMKNIDIRPATVQEIAAAQANNTNVSSETSAGETVLPDEGQVESSGVPSLDSVNQSITDGPYLVESKMLQGGEAAVFTTKSQVNNKSWIYLQIPMYYDITTGALSVSGSPVFVSPIDIAEVPSTEYETSWTNDQKVVDAISPDMTNYMKAWAASDDSTLERLTVKKDGENAATLAALQGLDKTVQLVAVNTITVESKEALKAESTATEKEDFLVRQSQISVTWLEPSSGMIYTQSYRVLIRYVNDNWFIEDIRNVSSAVDRDALPAPKTTETPVE